MAGLKPLKKPTKNRKALKGQHVRSVDARAKAGTVGLYGYDPGRARNMRERPLGRRGVYGTEKGNISYTHRGGVVKKTTKARKKPGPKKK